MVEEENIEIVRNGFMGLLILNGINIIWDIKEVKRIIFLV